MRALKRAGASLLALGVVAASMVMTATVASAHTGTLNTASVCQSDGTYKITYTGATLNVPATGPGHVAALTVGEIKPVGTKITGAPATVTGNMNYTFSETVPGTTTLAQATAFLVWGDGVKSDPIGQTTLAGDCKPPVIVKPSGSFTVACSATGADVTVGTLSPGTKTDVSWTLTYNGQSKTVSSGDVVAVPALATLTLKFTAGSTEKVVQYGTAPAACPPVVVAPTGSFTVVCSAAGANVTIGALSSGSRKGVVWTLIVGSTPQTVTAGQVVAVPALATLALKFTTADNDSKVVQSDTAPAACPPPVVVPPSGSFTVVCSATGANVTIGALSSGSRKGVVWTLTVGSTPQTVTAGQVVAVPALATLALKFTTADNDSKVVQSDTAPAACTPPVVVPPSGSFTVICSATGANVTVGTLDSGTRSDVVWTLTFGSDSKTVHSGDIVAVPALSAVALKFTIAGGDSQTAQSATAPAACAPPVVVPPVVVAPSGSFTVVCSATGANVTVGTLGSGTGSNVVWTLTVGSTPQTVTSGQVVAVPVSAALALKVTIAGGDSQTAQSATAPAACSPTAVLGVKIGKTPTAANKPAASNLPPAVLGTVLPHTGAPSHLPWTLGAAALFLMLGSALIFVARKPEVVRVR